MLCTAARGGMSAVVQAYRRDGLFERHQVQLLETHRDGPATTKLRMALGAWLQCLRLLAGGQVHALHAHMAMRGSFWRKSLFARTAQCFGVPVIAHLHGSEMKLFHAEQPRWRQRLIAAQLRASHCVLVLSPGWAEFVERIAPGARVVCLPNYVELPVLAQRPPQRPTVEMLFLGAVGARKGMWDLLPAFASALRRAPQLRLRVGGNGEVEPARALARQLGIEERVEFLGWVDGPRKQALLAQADAYVLPSHNEGLPVSVLEAMSWALPVLSTRVGGIPELVREDIDGLLVDAGDRAALADALVRLAQDAALRQRLGTSGRERVAQGYERSRVLPRLEAIYAEVCGGDPRPHLLPPAGEGAGALSPAKGERPG